MCARLSGGRVNQRNLPRPTPRQAAKAERVARDARLAWMRDSEAGVDGEGPLYLTQVRTRGAEALLFDAPYAAARAKLRCTRNTRHARHTYHSLV